MNIRLIPALMLVLGIAILVCGVSAATTTIVVTVTDEVSGDAISGASVYFAGSYVGLTDSYGKFEYTHSYSTTYRVGIKKSGYQYWSEQISSGKTALKVEMAREETTLTVNVLDSDNLEPLEDAVISVSGADIDTSKSTDESGSAEFRVSYDTSYVITIKLTNYETVVKTVEIADGEKSVDYLMQRNDLIIFQILDGESSTRTALSGAELYLDNKLSGITGSDGKITLNIEHERTYDIAVKMPNYVTWEEKHYFDSDEILYTATLYKSINPVTISAHDVNIKPIANAEVYVDGKVVGKTDTYGRSSPIQLSSGSHTFRVVKDGYVEYSSTSIIDESVTNIDVTLSFATVDVTINVVGSDYKIISGASVYVDGNARGLTDSSGKIVVDLIVNSDYIITVAADGYVGVKQELSLGTLSKTVTLTMSKDMTLIYIIVIVVIIAIVAGVAVYTLKNRRRGSDVSSVFGGRKGGFGGQRRPPRYNGGGGL